MPQPEKVIRVLNEAGIPFVLMGNYGMVGWRGSERATQDVDVLVRRNKHESTVEALRTAFPRLRVEDTPVATRFVEPRTAKVVIDVMKPVDAVYRAVFKNSVLVGESHRVPDLEMSLVCKYAAMVSPNRLAGKKHGDAWDFIEIVLHNFESIDRKKLRRLGKLMYAGGGEEILRFVDDAKAGRTLEL